MTEDTEDPSDFKARLKALRTKGRKLLYSPPVQKAMHTLGQVGGAAIHLTSQTTPVGKAIFMAGVAGAYLGTSPDIRQLYLDHDRVEATKPLVNFLFQTIKEDTEALVAIYKSPQRQVFALKSTGEDILFLVAGGPTGPDVEAFTILRKGMDEETAWGHLGKAVWTARGTDKLLLTIEESSIGLLHDPFEDSAPSKLADDIHQRVLAYNAKDYNRSVLLVGPPGTGKSFAARRVAELRGNYSIRHAYEYASAVALPRALDILQPKTLILDDICRNPPDNDTVETCKMKCPLLIATANYVDKLDPSLRRPGRFDEIIEVNTLDDAAIERMLPDLAFDVAKRLATLPAAYLEEFRVTREVHGIEKALERIEELTSRSEKLAEQTEIIDATWIDKTGKAG